jgi:hypothetical protein
MGARREPTFTAKAVCAAIGVPHGTLNSWAHAGVLRRFRASTTTPGKARRFPLRDLIMLAAIKRFSDLGIAPERAAGWARVMIRLMDRLGPQMTELNVRVYEDQDSVLPNDGLMAQEAQPKAGELVKVTIYPHAIVKDLKAKLATLTAGESAPAAAAETAPSASGVDVE